MIEERVALGCADCDGFLGWAYGPKESRVPHVCDCASAKEANEEA